MHRAIKAQLLSAAFTSRRTRERGKCISSVRAEEVSVSHVIVSFATMKAC